jgi:hypothetical protein
MTFTSQHLTGPGSARAFFVWPEDNQLFFFRTQPGYIFFSFSTLGSEM